MWHKNMLHGTRSNIVAISKIKADFYKVFSVSLGEKKVPLILKSTFPANAGIVFVDSALDRITSTSLNYNKQWNLRLKVYLQ